MKLLLITCIQEYEKEVKKMLKHSGVKAFSYHPVNGYSNDADSNAWFVAEEFPADSLMFTVFTDNKCIDELFQSFEEFNSGLEVNTKIHVACLEVNRSI